jgi:predicted RNA-binding Zn ribbon-like protein
VADALFEVFAAGDDGQRAALVAALLTETGVRPTVLAADGRVRESWSVADPDRAGRAAAALAFWAALAVHPGRLGVCADEKCADVYADASPAGHRRFCWLTCQDRARAVALRRRRARSG